MQNNLTYTIEQIKEFDENQWQDFRILRWSQKKSSYNDKDNVPDWFWPAQEAKNNEIRIKAWIKQCNRYSSEKPAEWFMADKNEYVKFCESIEAKKQKFLAKKN